MYLFVTSKLTKSQEVGKNTNPLSKTQFPISRFISRTLLM